MILKKLIVFLENPYKKIFLFPLRNSCTSVKSSPYLICFIHQPFRGSQLTPSFYHPFTHLPWPSASYAPPKLVLINYYEFC